MKFLITLAIKIFHSLLRRLGRGGTSMPGKLALRVCPNILSKLSKGLTAVVVTGTNGKTTTCELIRNAFRQAGIEFVSNSEGANMDDGIITALSLNTDFFGVNKAKYAVIECDEGHMKSVCSAIKPKVIVVNNIFRDQLDRYGEVTITRDKIIAGIMAAENSALVLNADCPLTASIGEQVIRQSGKARDIRYFSVSAELPANLSAHSDIPRCLNCGAPYEYSSHTFSHLGDWYCPDCGSKRPAADIEVTKAVLGIDSDDLTVKLGNSMDNPGEYNQTFTIPGMYNIYNAAACVAACWLMGIDTAAALDSLGKAQAPFGRLESFIIGGKQAKLMLAKNPEGLDRILEYLENLTEEINCVFVLNDNSADGTDVSWIYDVAFEGTIEKLVKTSAVFGAAGKRSGDMALRLKYAGVPSERLVIMNSGKEETDFIKASDKDVFITANYTAMLEQWDLLNSVADSKKAGGKSKWN